MGSQFQRDQHHESSSFVVRPKCGRPKRAHSLIKAVGFCKIVRKSAIECPLPIKEDVESAYFKLFSNVFHSCFAVVNHSLRYRRKNYRWAAFQPKKPEGDFEALTGHEAWLIIKEKQAPDLFRLYRRYLSGEDPEEIRFLAFESVPGLTQIWTEPYQLQYRCRDGALLIRFRKDGSSMEMEADLVNGK